MRFRSFAATTAAAALLALIPATPAVASGSDTTTCTRTAKGVTTCVRTYSEVQLTSTEFWSDYCEDAQGNVGQYPTEHYATYNFTESTTRKGRKVISHYLTWTTSDPYSVGPYCASI